MIKYVHIHFENYKNKTTIWPSTKIKLGYSIYYKRIANHVIHFSESFSNHSYRSK